MLDNAFRKDSPYELLVLLLSEEYIGRYFSTNGLGYFVKGFLTYYRGFREGYILEGTDKNLFVFCDIIPTFSFSTVSESNFPEERFFQTLRLSCFPKVALRYTPSWV